MAKPKNNLKLSVPVLVRVDRKTSRLLFRLARLQGRRVPQVVRSAVDAYLLAAPELDSPMVKVESKKLGLVIPISPG